MTNAILRKTQDGVFCFPKKCKFNQRFNDKLRCIRYSVDKQPNERMIDMNLKGAFRFQNRLQALMDECLMILADDSNVTKTERTHLRKKVMPETENETVLDMPASEYADRINDVAKLLMDLLQEQQRLSNAVHEAKAALELDFDAQAGLNKDRQAAARAFRRMADIRSSESVTANGGFGYRFNTDGNQVTYKCDVKRVTTINFDRNVIRRYMADLNRQADEISAKLDLALVSTEVRYDAPFDVNDSFADVLERMTGAA